jgi:hypothetical protein
MCVVLQRRKNLHSQTTTPHTLVLQRNNADTLKRSLLQQQQQLGDRWLQQARRKRTMAAVPTTTITFAPVAAAQQITRSSRLCICVHI